MRGRIRVLFSLFLLVLFLNLTSAYGYFDVRYQAQDVIQTAVDIFEPILEAVLGGGNGGGYTGEFLFEKLLFFIIIATIGYIALEQIPFFQGQRTKTIPKLIAGIVAIISVRYIGSEFVDAILLQYQVLGIVLTAILPFVIFFFFVMSLGEGNNLLRKVAWIFFIFVYIGLAATSTVAYASYYIWVAIAAILFLILDGPISKHYISFRIMGSRADHKYRAIARLDKQIKEIQDSTSIPIHEKNRLINQLENEIHTWSRR